MATTTVLRQQQPSVQDSLSPQKLREWAIWWGSPGGGASRARAGGAGAGGPRTCRREPLSSQQLRKRAVRWGSPGGGARCATTRGPCESTPAGSATCRHGGSGGGQQRQQRPPETLSPQKLREWAVRWGSPSGGAWGTSAGGGGAPGGVEASSLGAFDLASTGAEPEEALHTSTLDSGHIPVPVTLADPFGGPVVARGATVLPCLAAPFGLLTGLHLPSFAKNLVATSVLQDQWVTVTQPGGELVAICMDSCTGEHLATFTRRPGFGLYTLTTEFVLCRLLMHQTLLWHHRLGHPSLPCLHGMHSRLLVSGLPRSLPLLPRSLAPPCLPCVEGRQRAAPHSSFPPTTTPLQTLHMDMWGPTCVTRQGGEHYFLLVVDDYTRYTTIFPLQSKADVRGVLIRWIRAIRLQLRARFREDLPVLRLHSDRGGEFCSHLLKDFCGTKGIRQMYTLPASPQQNGIAERHIGLVMEVARTSMIHAAAPHFMWPFAIRYATEQLNLWPRVSHPETSPTLRWTGEVGDASAFRVSGSLSLVCDLPAGKLSPRTLQCVFLGFPTDALPWQFYHSGSRHVLSSQDVTFDESVCFYRLHPHRSSPVPFPPLSLMDDPPSIAPLPPPGGGTIGGAGFGGAGSGGAECPLGTGDTGGTGVVGPAPSRQEALSPERLREWAVQWGSPGGGASHLRAGGAGAAGAGGTGTAGAGGSTAGGSGVARAGSTSARRQETLSPERLREWAVQWGNPGGGASHAHSPRAGGTGGAASVGGPSSGAGRAGGAGFGGARLGGTSTSVPGTGGTGAAGGASSRGTSPRGAGAGVPGTGGTGGALGAGGTEGATGGVGGTGVSGARWQESLLPLQLREWAVRWGSPGGGAGATGSGGAVATRAGGSGGATTQPQPSALSRLLSLPPTATEFPVPGTTPPLLFPPLLPGSPLPAPAPHTEVTASLTARRELETRASTPEHREPETRASVLARTCRVRRPRAPAVPGTHDMTLRPSSVPHRVVLPSPPASSLPHVPDPESDLVRAASLTVTHLLATVVSDPSFESAAASALVAELVDFAALCRLDYAVSLVFDSSSPPSVGGELALGCDVLEDRQFELECLAAAAPHLASSLLCPEGDPDAPDIPTPRTYAEAITGPYSSQWQIAMEEEMASWKSTDTYVDEVPPPGANIVDGMWIFRVKRPPGSLPAFKARYVARGFIYGLRQAPREWQDTLRTTLAALGFAPSTADPSLFLRTDTSLPLLYVLVYIDDLVFATADTKALALVLQRFDFMWSSPQPIPLSTGHSLSAPPLDESVEPSGPYPELVGCLITSGMGLVLGGQGSVALTGHSDAFWADDQTTHQSTQGYSFSLGTGSVSWRSTRSSYVLSSSCEAEIHAGAMAAQELQWLTYLLTDLGERPCSPPVLYVNNKAMIALR
ncbi:unnamed protein product [Closterium sp. NIES-54]